MRNTPLIALISATPAAIGPATAALNHEFDDADIWNLLDDRLLVEANASGGMTPRLEERMLRLIDHARAEGASGVLLTCSMFGLVAHIATTDSLPVLAADDAAFETIADRDYSRVLLVASLRPAALDAERRLQAYLQSRDRVTTVQTAVVEAAFTAADRPTLLSALVESILPFVGEIDAILLAQYSLAPVGDELSAKLGLPVLAGPISAAQSLRALVAAQEVQAAHAIR